MDLIVAAWIFYNNKLLLIYHKKSGLWLPVGGHVERDENLITALHREVQEEVNLTIDVLAPWPVVFDTEKSKELPLPFRLAEYQGANGLKLTFDFIARAHHNTVIKQDEEIADFIWLTLDEIDDNKHLSERIKALAKLAFEEFRKFSN